jgi:hypothetical protein
MLSSYEDADGHRLYFFEDSLFIAYVGNNAEMFYRRPQLSFGRYRAMDDLVILESFGLGKLSFKVMKDSICNKGICLRFIDRNGYALYMDHVEVMGPMDSAALWSDLYNMYYAEQWAPEFRVVDTWGRFEMEPIVLPDSACHSYRIMLPLRFFELDDRMILEAYQLRRQGMELVPVRSYPLQRAHDPMFSMFTPEPIDRAERKRLERRAWNLKAFGHPDWSTATGRSIGENEHQ